MTLDSFFGKYSKISDYHRHPKNVRLKSKNYQLLIQQQRKGLNLFTTNKNMYANCKSYNEYIFWKTYTNLLKVYRNQSVGENQIKDDERVEWKII